MIKLLQKFAGFGAEPQELDLDLDFDLRGIYLRYRIILLVLGFLMVVPALSVGAQNIGDMQQQQREIREEAQSARDELGGTRRAIEGLEAEIYHMDQVLDAAVERFEVITAALNDTKLELAETEEALKEAQLERDEHFDRFKTRLRVMYIHGPVVYLEVVLQASSFSDFLTRVEHMNTLARSDREMAERLRIAEEQVNYQLEETWRLSTSMESMQLMQADRISEIDLLLDQKYDFMMRLEGDAYQFEALLRNLEQADQELTSEIQRLQAEEAARRRREQEEERRRQQATQVVALAGGSMVWPVPGHMRVTSGYGPRNHPISRRPENHSGIDIGAPTGTYIVAALGGTVIISGWQGGYGNTIVIDHGGGISTLYGHNSRNLVNVGDRVDQGQVIGRVGSTGVSTGPHLHFEVRHNGRHVDPGPYLGMR